MGSACFQAPYGKTVVFNSMGLPYRFTLRKAAFRAAKQISAYKIAAIDTGDSFCYGDSKLTFPDRKFSRYAALAANSNMLVVYAAAIVANQHRILVRC
jgi:hypothetical protein